MTVHTVKTIFSQNPKLGRKRDSGVPIPYIDAENQRTHVSRILDQKRTSIFSFRR